MNITKYLTVTNFATATNKQNLYIVIHYTANNGDTALNNAKYFYSEYRGASAHYFVDENEIVQVVEDAHTAWHCGTSGTYYSSCRNSCSIGIEMCSRYADGAYYFKDEVVEKTIELTQYLMNLYNIPKENIIMHYDVTRKTCPAPFVNNAIQWEDFKSQLDEIEVNKTTTQGDDEMITQEQWDNFYANHMADLMDNDSSDWSKEARAWAVEKGIVQGTSTAEFNGQWEKPLTREEMVVMMFRFYDVMKGE